jgi:hypothetical protein
MRYLRNRLVLIPLCAFVVRVGAIIALGSYHIPEVVVHPPMSVADPHFSFANEIGSIAQALVTGHGYSTPFGVYAGPTAWISPVYPFLAAGVFQCFGLFTDASGFVLLVFASLCAALTCIPIIKIGERLDTPASQLGKNVAWSGRRCGIVSAWIWALAPFFVRPSVTMIWDTSLLALLMSLAMLWTFDMAASNNVRSWALYGALWALMALANPVMLSFLGVALLWIGWQRIRCGSAYVPVPHTTAATQSYSFFRDLRLVAIMMLVFAAGISPWIVRNRIAFGKWIFIRSNFGFEFYFGNGHTRNPFGWAGGHPSANPRERADYLKLGELGYVNSRNAQTLQFIREYPGEFADRFRAHVWGFWAGVPVTSFYNDNRWQPWLFAPLSLLSLLGTFYLCTRQVHGAGLFAGIMLLYPLPFYIAFPQERHRHPMEPFMLIAAVFLAGIQQSELVRWLANRTAHNPELVES